MSMKMDSKLLKMNQVENDAYRVILFIYTKKIQKGCMVFIGTYINYKTETGMIHILNFRHGLGTFNLPVILF